MMKIREILDEIGRIKKNRRGITNYYNHIDKDSELDFEAFKAGGTIVFVEDERIDDMDIVLHRVYFYTNQPNELTEILKNMEYDSVIDIVGKNPDELKDEIKLGGFSEYAVFERISRDEVKLGEERVEEIEASTRSLYDEKYGFFPTEEDAHEIRDKMMEVFDPYTYHLLSLDEVKKSIEDGLCIIHKENGKIVGIAIHSIEGKKCNCHYMYNDGSIDQLLTMQYKLKIIEKEMGIKYYYGWQDVKNRRAAKVNKFASMTSDGVYDVVYVKKKD